MCADSIAPTAKVPKGGTVHLMLTCLCDAFYPEVGRSAVEVLEKQGYKVAFASDQTCCSQPAFNTGDWDAARKVARHTLTVFRDAEAIVCPSGSCTAMLRWGFPQLFRGEPDYEEAIKLASKSWELLEFLTLHDGVDSWSGSFNKKVALHRSCHLRELKTGNAPERLLRTINGIEILDLKTPEQCCGFGGAFTVSFPWTSKAMGEAKLCDLAATGAEVIASTDMGCVMHLRGMVAKDRKDLRLMHVAEILAESIR